MKRIFFITLALATMFVFQSCKKSCGVAPNGTPLYKKNGECFFYSEDSQGNEIEVDYPCDYCTH